MSDHAGERGIRPMNKEELIKRLKILEEPFLSDPHYDDDGTGLFLLCESIGLLRLLIELGGLDCD